MCGRYTLRTPGHELAEVFQLLREPELAPRYNIAPTQAVAAVRAAGDSAGRELVLLHWGLVPSWSRDPKAGARMINARAESAASKPAFRSAFKRRRCLVLADGFYEWRKQGKQKQPYYIRRRDEAPFAFAGLWEHWRSPEGDELQSCTILTKEAAGPVRPIHDRMPVILNENDYDDWLDPRLDDAERIEPLLNGLPVEELTLFPVSTIVNSPKNDAPECIEPIGS